MKCKECGKEDLFAIHEDSAEKAFMRQEHICHSCAFWNLKQHETSIIIIEGIAYDPSYNRPPVYGTGRYNIFLPRTNSYKFTRNLTCIGKIPAHYLPIFPDNAKFLSDNEVDTLVLLKVLTQSDVEIELEDIPF